MAVAVVLDFEGGTLEQYDRVVELMGLERGGAGPEGALFHWVTVTDDGIRVTDVWESREQIAAYAETSIGPHSQAAGLPGPPQITFHDVHNHFTAG